MRGVGISVSHIGFSDALRETSECRRHLLLGNGFSIEAYKNFNYTELAVLARAQNPDLIRAFPEPQTDFELAMRALPEKADLIREGLLNAITYTHPKWADILPSRKDSCATFLSKFLRSTRNRGVVFTTNYDMMLYWVLVMHRAKLNCGDGFNRVTKRWSGGLDNALVFYLHGALHLYEDTSASEMLPNIYKLKADNRQDLVDSIRRTMRAGAVPVFVSEGAAEGKLQKIRRNNYLSHAFTRFQKACSRPADVLFVVGHGLKAPERHLTAEICKGSIERLYVGVFTEGDRDRVQWLAEGWRKWRKDRGLGTLQVKTFWTRDAEIWKPAQ